MPDLPTFSDLFRIGRDEILTKNSKLSRDAVEREGMDANVLLAGACAVADEVVGQVSTLEAGLFLDSSIKSQLDRLVFDRYGLIRKPAAASLGTVQFRTGGVTTQAFTIPAGVKLATGDGTEFITTESVIFPNASTGPVNCAVRSVLAGAGQNVKANQIASIRSQIVNQPTNLTVTNPLATAGGDDKETDDSLRDRARVFFTTVRRGTIGAIEAAALGVPGVRKATAIEVVDAVGRPARVVQLVVTDSFTEQFVDLSAVPARYQNQSQLLATTVFNSLSDVRPAGMFVQVIVANVVMQAIQLTLTFNAGVDANEVALRARAALVGYTNELAPGRAFLLDDALKVLRRVSGLAPSGNSIISPLGNVQVKPLQVLRTSLGIVSALSAQTDQPIITGTNPDAYTLASN